MQSDSVGLIYSRISKTGKEISSCGYAGNLNSLLWNNELLVFVRSSIQIIQLLPDSFMLFTTIISKNTQLLWPHSNVSKVTTLSLTNFKSLISHLWGTFLLENAAPLANY